jgi:hypothetical protein
LWVGPMGADGWWVVGRLVVCSVDKNILVVD